MINLRDLPIRRKLRSLVMVTCGAALLLACGAFAVHEWYAFRQTLPRQRATLGEIVGANCAAAVMFNDAQSAERTLAALAAEPHIIAACVYTPDGKPFATYVRRDATGWTPPGRPADGERFDRNQLVVSQPIIRDRERIGTMYIESDLRELNDRLLRYAGIVVAVLVVALLVAWVVTGRLEHLISGPILQLVETAQAVTERHDYSLRATVTGRDEVGRLIESFNRMLAQIQARDEALQRSNLELQDFAHVASHDLQEPLRKIQAFGDRLKTKFAPVLSDDGRDYLERMQNAAGRMQTLINDLLAFSRVTTKAQPFVPVNLHKITQEVLGDLEVRIEQTAAQIEIGEMATIQADPMQMRQLLQNLIGNALKFRREYAKPAITVSAHANGDGRCRLTVADNGIGFDMKYVDKIFGMFQRLHGRDEYEGTGVGLAICRKIAERHGGQIAAESSPGRGATFIVTLPVQQEGNQP